MTGYAIPSSYHQTTDPSQWGRLASLPPPPKKKRRRFSWAASACCLPNLQASLLGPRRQSRVLSDAGPFVAPLNEVAKPGGICPESHNQCSCRQAVYRTRGRELLSSLGSEDIYLRCHVAYVLSIADSSFQYISSDG